MLNRDIRGSVLSYWAVLLIARQQHSAGRPATALACTHRRRASCRPPIILISIIPPSITHIEGVRRIISTATTPWVRQWGRPIITTTIKRRVCSTCIIVNHLHVSPNFNPLWRCKIDVIGGGGGPKLANFWETKPLDDFGSNNIWNNSNNDKTRDFNVLNSW